MRSFSRAAVFVLVPLIAAGPAHALSYVVGYGAPDPGAATGEDLISGFEGPLPGGYTLIGNYTLATGSGAPAGDGTQYLSVSPDPSGVTFTTIDLTNVSFYWGAVDASALVEVLGYDGVTMLTVSGADLADTRLYFTAGADEAITGLHFTANGDAYGVDDVAGTLLTGEISSPTPEPAAWALIVAGFGVSGTALRRQRRTVAI